MDVPTEFEWDDAKAERNARHHGITFHEARAVFLDPGHVVVDTIRKRDAESRQKLIGLLEHDVFRRKRCFHLNT